jgi:hypothetical protein
MKDFTLFQEALALKELGFDEPCLGYHDSEGLQFGVIFWWNRENKNSLFVEAEKTNNPKISAPTYSQAFRFFRNNYQIHGEVMLIKGNLYTWECYQISESKMMGVKRITSHESVSSNEFNSYPEAELACLRKLIEIVRKALLKIDEAGRASHET